MGKQYNKVEKRQRRLAYLKRRRLKARSQPAKPAAAPAG